MKPTATKLKVFAVLLFALFVPCRNLPTPTLSASDFPKPTPCSSPEHRQFDFWLGDWDVFDLDQPTLQVARAQINLILDSCVVHEDYKDNDGKEGQSFSIYDASRKAWHQSWVTNHGQMLEIQGGMQSGAMVLTGSDYTPDGKPRRVRGVWKPVSEGIRETAVTSLDGGKTWQPWFDLIFRPHK